MPKNKTKGSNVGRYRVVRVAGSGTMKNADCDIIAGKKGAKFSIEVKSSKKPIKYITKKQINDFIVFSDIFKLKPVIALRFNREGWFFLNPRHLKDTGEDGKNWVITLKEARKKGKRFSQFFR
jgi:Holliday junction resolvase